MYHLLRVRYCGGRSAQSPRGIGKYTQRVVVVGYKRGGRQRALYGWVGGNHYHTLLDLCVATFTVCHANMHMCRSNLNVWARSGAASVGLVNRLYSAAIAQAVAKSSAPI